MPGFDNNTMFAGNVDFSGADPVTPQVTTDGQLLIGSTAVPHIKVGTLTSTDGSIVITPGSGTIDLSSMGINVNQDQIYYVGKHGNDANSGLNIEQAKLTFGAAITAATALTPTANNRFAIVCLDDGIYTENITDVPFVDIFAPNATLGGTLIVDDNCNIKFFAQTVPTAVTAITKPAGSVYSNVEIEIITLAGTANGCTCSTGFLNLTWKELYVVDGYGIGDISVGLGHIHIKGGDIYISGTGIGIIRANTGSTVGRVDHILDIGGGTGSAIIVYDGTVDINVSKIEVTNAYNVQGATSILNIFCNEIVGTQLCSLGGKANVWTPPTYPINQAGMTNGQLVIGSTGNNPVVSALTAGTGISITNGAGSITIASITSGFAWTDAVNASYNLAVQNGYICDRGGGVTFTLPATAVQGDTIKIVGSVGLWTIAQNANQSIGIGNATTTIGVGGSLTATNAGDCIEIVCIVAGASTTWRVTSVVGNITVV